MISHRRKLAIVAAATLATAATATRNADGQNVYGAAISAQSGISVPVVPVTSRFPIISPSQWIINNPTLSNPTLKPTFSSIPSAPTPFVRAAPLIEAKALASATPVAVAPISAVPIVPVKISRQDSLRMQQTANIVPVAVPVSIPVAISVIPTELNDANGKFARATPAVQQAALSRIFDGNMMKGESVDISGLVGEIKSQIKAQADGVGQRTSKQNSNQPKSIQTLSKGDKLEYNDFTLTLEDIRSTIDGMGEAHMKVKSKHSKETADLHIKNDESGMFTIVNLKERWQKVFSVKVVSLISGEVAIDVEQIIETEIYTQAAMDREHEPIVMGVGENIELGAGGIEVVDIKNGYVKFHVVCGESEWEFWLKSGQSKEIYFEEEDYHETFIIKAVSLVAKDGKPAVELSINRKK